MVGKSQYPIEERLWFACVLTMIAGSLDAYSFLFHGGVFAGLQTGNLILLGIHLGQHSLGAVIRHTLSILAFIIGTIVIRSVQLRFLIRVKPDESPQQAFLRDRRQQQLHLVVLAYEIIMIILSIFLDMLGNTEIAAMFLSMAVAGELEEFRKVRGQTFTPLTMTSDLRALAEAVFDESVSHAATARQNVIQTFALMFCFIAGATLVGYTQKVISNRTILIPLIILIMLALALLISYVKHFKIERLDL